jgi:hypothetical protein
LLRGGSAATMAAMKLAEALSLRSDAQKRLAQLQARAVASARFQEGEDVPEDANALLAEAREVVAEVESLVRRINRTNAAVELEPGITITDAIARRDALASERSVLVAIADAAAGSGARAGGFGRQLRSELRFLTNVPIPQLRTEADALARQYRELDTRLQEANWTTELLD